MRMWRRFWKLKNVEKIKAIKNNQIGIQTEQFGLKVSSFIYSLRTKNKKELRV